MQTHFTFIFLRHKTYVCVVVSFVISVQAINLVSPFTPMFDPTLFGRHGKVMDSWESQRHNKDPYHEVRYADSKLVC